MSDPAPNPAPTPSPAPAPAVVDKTVDNLLAQVQALKDEANGHKGAAEAARLAEKTAKEAAEAAIAEAATKANQRIITAELKAHALKAGMSDLDFLKLIDTSEVTLGDDGEVKIPEKFFDKLKTAKPHYFGAAATTSQPAPAPAPSNAPGNSVRDLSKEDYKKRRLELVRGAK